MCVWWGSIRGAVTSPWQSRESVELTLARTTAAVFWVGGGGMEKRERRVSYSYQPNTCETTAGANQPKHTHAPPLGRSSPCSCSSSSWPSLSPSSSSSSSSSSSPPSRSPSDCCWVLRLWSVSQTHTSRESVNPPSPPPSREHRLDTHPACSCSCSCSCWSAASRRRRQQASSVR